VDSLALDGGRRSRRGFQYQDAVTLLDCLDMHAGAYDSVGFEDLDDIVCTARDGTTYRQVKTKEDATRHTIATVCRPELKDRVETSILGRLFSGKPCTAESRFCLVVNETPQADLDSFRTERGTARGKVPQKHRDDIAKRLQDLPVTPGQSITYFVDRFEVLVEARTIEQVEDAILRRLDGPVAAVLGQPGLWRELEDVLIRLSTLLAREASQKLSRHWDAATFKAALLQAIAASTGRRPDGSTEPLQRLRSKLQPAGLTAEEAEGHLDLLLRYRRRYRSAVGGERQLLDDLNDHVFALCSEVSARRRAGHIEPGPAAYAATIHAVTREPFLPSPSLPVRERLAALADVTARCQNRYTDVT
jgi:hypothetical protein